MVQVRRYPLKKPRVLIKMAWFLVGLSWVVMFLLVMPWFYKVPLILIVTAYAITSIRLYWRNFPEELFIHQGQLSWRIHQDIHSLDAALTQSPTYYAGRFYVAMRQSRWRWLLITPDALSTQAICDIRLALR